VSIPVAAEDRGVSDTPQLEGEALAAVRHRGSHLQIIAAAGSGKTEVVSQRVADLLADGVAPEGIVAFTFTQRAAKELGQRIARRVEGRLGRAALDRLNGLYVGTIHGYCFRLLQQRVPRYETYDVLDDNQLTAFLSREAKQLDLRQLDPTRRLFASIRAFRTALDVVENELLDVASLPEPLASIMAAHYATLDRYRLLTYGQQVVAAVRELSRPELAAEVHAALRHLIIDEYQDVNPAQERLIGLLTGPATELCVVGDDHQAIYQWRGSDVANIVGFAGRYPSVATFGITANRRSRPGIIEVANRFSATIAASLPKTMTATRHAAAGGGPEVVVWSAPTEADEAGWIAGMIDDWPGRASPTGTWLCSCAAGRHIRRWGTRSRRSTSPCHRTADRRISAAMAGWQVGGQDRGLVLPQPGDPHRQLRPGRLRGLRRRGRLRARRRRRHHRAPGQGPRVAGGVRAVDDRRPVPDPPDRPGPSVAGAPGALRRGALRGQRRG
jgi:DNA helicase-2/ATP-dependent DNA helicase PcrA